MMISVIGGEASGDAALDAAEAVGREIDRRGDTLVGGGRGGVLAAAGRGPRAGGGHTIGLMPGRTGDGMPRKPTARSPVFTVLSIHT